MAGRAARSARNGGSAHKTLKEEKENFPACGVNALDGDVRCAFLRARARAPRGFAQQHRSNAPHLAAIKGNKEKRRGRRRGGIILSKSVGRVDSDRSKRYGMTGGVDILLFNIFITYQTR